MSVTGTKESGPVKAGNAMGDMLGGLNLTIGILAALHARTIIGHGQRVDVSLVDAVVVSLENVFTRYWYSGVVPEREGNANPATAPYNAYQAKDGLVIIACGNQHLFEKFANDVAKKPEWISDMRYIDNVTRVAHFEELKTDIEAWGKDYTVSEIVDCCLANGVPSGPVYDVSQIVKDEHIVKDRNMFPIVHHPVIGDMHVNGDAVKLMETKPRITKLAPTLGEDNVSVYGEFAGLSEEIVKEYKEKGIV